MDSKPVLCALFVAFRLVAFCNVGLLRRRFHYGSKQFLKVDKKACNFKSFQFKSLEHLIREF